MSDAPVTDAAVPSAGPAPRTRRFRASDLPRLATDAAAREGQIVQFAIRHLGAARAMTFLNAEHAGLAGRPLAIGTASAAGTRAVEDAIRLAAAAAASA